MSKQSEAKERQGYALNPVNRQCQNCKHFKYDEVLDPFTKEGAMVRGNLRCGLGLFKVILTSNCANNHEFS